MSLITQLEKDTRFTRAGRGKIVPSHTPACLQDGSGWQTPILSTGGRNPFDPHELATWLRKAQPVSYRQEQGNEWRSTA